MKPFRFCTNHFGENVIELTISHNVVRNRLYLDWLVGVDDNTVTIQYPLPKELLKQLKEQIAQLDGIVSHYKLKDSRETKFHISNLLYFIIEFSLKHRQLRQVNTGQTRAKHHLKFLKLVEPLTDYQKQQVSLKLVIKSKPFEFNDDPILSEIVINKLYGLLIQEIRHLYPNLWQEFKGEDPMKKRKVADSVLRNKVVAEIAKMMQSYLNEESIALSQIKINPNITVTSTEQRNFIYEVLTLFNLYIPREVQKPESNKKLDPSEGLRKLIERSTK